MGTGWVICVVTHHTDNDCDGRIDEEISNGIGTHPSITHTL